MNSRLTEKDSLKLISDMIALAKGNANQSFFHIILWGWVIIIISLSQYVLIQISGFEEQSSLVWLLTLPAGVVSGIYGYQQGKKEKSRSFIDYIYKWIWFSFVISLVVTLFISIKQHNYVAIPSYVMVLAGMATFLSGLILKFKPLIWGGVAFWFWAIIAFQLGNNYDLIVQAIGIFTGYIIPGYLLKSKLKKNEFQ